MGIVYGGLNLGSLTWCFSPRGNQCILVEVLVKLSYRSMVNCLWSHLSLLKTWRWSPSLAGPRQFSLCFAGKSLCPQACCDPAALLARRVMQLPSATWVACCCLVCQFHLVLLNSCSVVSTHQLITLYGVCHVCVCYACFVALCKKKTILLSAGSDHMEFTSKLIIKL